MDGSLRPRCHRGECPPPGDVRNPRRGRAGSAPLARPRGGACLRTASGRGAGDADPAGADTYVSRAHAFLDSLDAFDREAAALLAPVAGVPFAVHHPAFKAFADRYGLALTAVLEQHPEGEALPHSLGTAAIDLDREGARVVFAEPQLSRRIAEAMAAELGARVALLDPLGGELSPGREDYFSLLRWNVRQLVENLR